MFSIPRTPHTSRSPGQFNSIIVPDGMKVIITDIYVENLGGGPSYLLIMEQRGENSFELRYVFRTPDNKTTALHFRTGLRLGEECPIKSIRIENASYSKASILPRVNGIFVCSHC
jgi:hypothetical protein